MDIQNHFYGHSGVLSHYCGCRTRHLNGLLQHGWVVRSPLETNFGDFPKVGADGDRRRLLVWSHSSRAWDPAASDRPSVAIGAPWLYLRRMAESGDLPEPALDGRRPLIMPMHGTHVAKVQADHGALARYYLEKEGPATICLHVEDLTDRALVEAWQIGGNTVVSAGGRFDPLFLPRLFTGMRQASRVVTNRLSTSVWYAASLGLEAAVYGPPPTFAGDAPGAYERLRDGWPEVHDEHPDVAEAQLVALAELGGDYLRSPEELRSLAGWEHPASLTAGTAYWLGAPLAKAANVLGISQRAGGRPAPAPTTAPSASPGSAPAAEAIAPAAPAQPRAIDFLRHPFSHLPRPLPRGEAWQGGPVDWIRPQR
ncbi:MAG: hypothetical protein ACXVYU_08820 [Oryzihumus sp.]